MESRFERNIPALTEAECALLRRKRVLIVGCGGLGGHLVELMTRIGIGALRVCDGDVFDQTNLNRQLLATAQTLGTSKAEAAKARALQIDPALPVEAYPLRMTQENVHPLIAGCDAVLDGLDNVESRRILARACSQAGIPYVFGAIGGWVAQAAISMPGDGLIDGLYPEGTVIQDKSVLSFTPALCASMQAALCTRLLAGYPVKTGKLYYFDLFCQEFETIPMV